MLHTVDVVLRSHDSACTTCKDHTIMCTGSHDFVQRSHDFVLQWSHDQGHTIICIQDHTAAGTNMLLPPPP